MVGSIDSFAREHTSTTSLSQTEERAAYRTYRTYRAAYRTYVSGLSYMAGGLGIFLLGSGNANTPSGDLARDLGAAMGVLGFGAAIIGRSYLSRVQRQRDFADSGRDEERGGNETIKGRNYNSL